MMDKSSRKNPLDISTESFRSIGHKLIDDIAEMLENISHRPLTKGESPSMLKSILGSSSLPSNGMNAKQLMTETTKLLFDHFC